MKVLLAVDGSLYSDAAVEEVGSRQWPAGSIVRVMSVIQPYVPPATEIVLAGAMMEQIRSQLSAEATELTSRVAASLRQRGFDAETIVREGDPRSAIVDEAAEWNADLIVVGSHGRTGLKRWLLGSVAGSIVSHAPCSVEVVRRPADRKR
jgi:nucleotide-binding universal stress UspA family protein